MSKLIRVLMVLGLVVVPLTGCQVEQTEEGELPEVQVEEGQMPEYDVDTPEVEVGTEEETIEVPDVDVEPAGEEEPPAEQPAEQPAE